MMLAYYLTVSTNDWIFLIQVPAILLHFHDDHRASEKAQVDLNSTDNNMCYLAFQIQMHSSQRLHCMSVNHLKDKQRNLSAVLLPQQPLCNRQKDGVEKACCFSASNRAGPGLNSASAMEKVAYF